MPSETLQPLNPLESPESSSPIITRAVAAGLRDEYCDAYTFSPWQKAALRLLGRLRPAVGREVVSRLQAFTGVDPQRLHGLSIDTLAQERLRDYASLEGPFPAVVMGAGLGGAAAHLALAVGGPFLPQAFVVTLRGGAPNGSIQTYYEQSARLAQSIAQANRNILTLQHYDPVHDGWVTRYANHLRFKLLDLPETYTAFLRRHLEPGGAVCFLDSGARWLRYRVGDRSYFQVGGWGDISAEEFLEGSDRLLRYCREAGLTECSWKLEGFPLEEGPESEWGVEPGLGEALERFCRQGGYRFVRISLPEPHDYSRLAFQAAAHLIQKQGQRPAGVLVEMFSQYDATAVQRSGLLPLWLVYNTWDSLAFLKQMIPAFPHGQPVFFSPLATFTHTPDLVPWSGWESALQDLDWVNVGARPSHYPDDTLAVADWAAPLRRWAAAHPQPITTHLEPEELLQVATELLPRPKAS